MKHASLFSGIGGFDLAAEWMGWENVFHCEINEFGQKILKHYWPKAISYNDITKTDFTIHRGNIDIITGGFPCQPFSVAGKQKGVEDERFLWHEMLRAIKEIQPRWIVAENVFGILNNGGGMVFEQVCSEMENEGYEVQPYLLPACSVGAPHKRDRFWFVAHSKSGRPGRLRNEREAERPYSGNELPGISGGVSLCEQSSSNSNSERLQGCALKRASFERGEKFNKLATGLLCTEWENFPTQPAICGGNDGVPYRVDRLKALGNAIVPQIAYEIFKAIEQFEQL